MGLNLQKYKQQNSKKYSIKNQPNKVLQESIYPANSTYALRRRLIVPKWWFESILLTHGKQHAWYSSFLADHYDRRVFEYFKVTATNIFFMFFLWNELSKQMFASPNKNISKVKIDITKFLNGTEKQNALILKNIEENLIKPIKIFNVTKSEETFEVNLTRNGYLNIFKKVVLDKDVNGIWLTLYFSQKSADIFASPDVKSKKETFQNSFVTINPNLFYVMGSRVNMKKAINSLFLEYNKQNETLDPVHTAFNIDMPAADSFREIVSSTAQNLYEHGVLAKTERPPMMKISRIKKRQKLAEDEEESPFVFAWGLSAQTREARNFEDTLSKQLTIIRQNANAPKLFREPPRDELQKIRNTHPNVHAAKQEFIPPPIKESPIKPDNIPKFESGPHPVVQNTQNEAPATTLSTELSAEPPPPYAPPKKPNFHIFTERELSIFVIRFYETLNQKQKKMFEYERRNMTREQFRSFMIPILQRTHATLTPS